METIITTNKELQDLEKQFIENNPNFDIVHSILEICKALEVSIERITSESTLKQLLKEEYLNKMMDGILEKFTDLLGEEWTDDVSEQYFEMGEDKSYLTESNRSKLMMQEYELGKSMDKTSQNKEKQIKCLLDIMGELRGKLAQVYTNLGYLGIDIADFIMSITMIPDMVFKRTINGVTNNRISEDDFEKLSDELLFGSDNTNRAFDKFLAKQLNN